MRRFILCILSLCFLLSLSSCKETVSIKKMAEGFEGEYQCVVNVQDKIGNLLFSAKLYHNQGAYTFEITTPKEIEGTKIIIEENASFAEITDFKIPLSDKAYVNLSFIKNVFEKIKLGEGKVSEDKQKLYAADCNLLYIDDIEVYFTNDTPLLIQSEEIRVEIIGLKYMKGQ